MGTSTETYSSHFLVTFDWPQLLRDPLWQFASVLLAVVAIVVAIFLYRKQRRLKRLDFEIISETSLLSVKEELEGKLQILYEGRRVSTVHLVLAEFRNSGTEPILAGDFVQPLGVDFGTESQVLTTEVVETFPTDSNAVITTATSRLTIAPLLVNQRDFIRVKCLVENYADSARATGRIVGISKIRRRTPGDVAILPLILMLVGSVGFVAALGHQLWTLRRNTVFPHVTPGLTRSDAIGLLSWLLVILGLLSDRGGRRKLFRTLALLPYPFEFTKPRSAGSAVGNASNKDFAILFARYGAGTTWRDVTSLLRASVRDGALRFTVANEVLGGDPIPNVPKRIELTYSHGGQTYSKAASEGESLLLPES